MIPAARREERAVIERGIREKLQGELFPVPEVTSHGNLPNPLLGSAWGAGTPALQLAPKATPPVQTPASSSSGTTAIRSWDRALVPRPADAATKRTPGTLIRVSSDWHNVQDVGPRRPEKSADGEYHKQVPLSHAKLISELKEDDCDSFVVLSMAVKHDVRKECRDSPISDLVDATIVTDRRTGKSIWFSGDAKYSTVGKEHVLDRIHASVHIDDNEDILKAVTKHSEGRCVTYAIRTYHEQRHDHPQERTFDTFVECVRQLRADIRANPAKFERTHVDFDPDQVVLGSTDDNTRILKGKGRGEGKGKA